jgi:hypothetical protein
LTDILLYPTLDRLYYQEEHISTGSSTIDNVRIYKHNATVDLSDASAERKFDFAILKSSKTVDSLRTSKMYFGNSDQAFDMDRARTSLTLFNMWQPNYASSFEKSSEKDFLRQMDPEGGPDVVGWQTVPQFYLSSVEFEGKHNFQSCLPYTDKLK